MIGKVAGYPVKVTVIKGVEGYEVRRDLINHEVVVIAGDAVTVERALQDIEAQAAKCRAAGCAYC